MASNFPTSLDSYAVLVDNTDSIVAAHPNDRGDAIENLEAKVGINSSAVATSHDYLLRYLPAQSGNWDAGSYEIRSATFESDIATGTAPFTIASTTVCTNLNADMVDGKHVAGTNGAGEITTNDGSQTLTSKTITSPDINGGTWNGTIDGNWTAASQTCANLGTVTTCDVNGGSIDGVTIGAAAAPTVANLGSVATCDINGGTVNGISSLSCSAGASITEFSTDGTLGGNSDTAVPTEKAVKTYVDAKALGSWVDKSSSYAAQQATTDGFLVVYLVGPGSGDGLATGYTDVNADPSTIRGVAEVGTATEKASFCFPVKKSDYWKVVVSGTTSSIKVYFIPLG